MLWALLPHLPLAVARLGSGERTACAGDFLSGWGEPDPLSSLHPSAFFFGHCHAPCPGCLYFSGLGSTSAGQEPFRFPETWGIAEHFVCFHLGNLIPYVVRVLKTTVSKVLSGLVISSGKLGLVPLLLYLGWKQKA